jgi:hypothetical protein
MTMVFALLMKCELIYLRIAMWSGRGCLRKTLTTLRAEAGGHLHAPNGLPSHEQLSPMCKQKTRIPDAA